MALMRCLHCGLPMTESEATSGGCPSCGNSLKSNAPVTSRPAATMDRARHAADRVGWSWLLPALAALALPVAGICYVLWGHDSTRPVVIAPDDNSFSAGAQNDTDQSVAPPKPAQSSADVSKSTPMSKPAPDNPLVKAKTAPPHRPAAEAKGNWKREDRTVTTTSAKKPPGLIDFPNPFDKIERRPVVKDKDFTIVKALNAPEGTFDVGNVLGGAKVKLRGKVHRLQVGEINGRGVLDASELEAKEIILTRPINGGSFALFHAPGGKVVFLGEINGGSQVAVSAPDGAVILGDPSKGRGKTSALIGGDSRLHVVAREVDLRGAVHGAKTTVEVTFTGGGRLKFHELNAGQILYRTLDDDAPPPAIQWGTILAQGKLTKVK